MASSPAPPAPLYADWLDEARLGLVGDGLHDPAEVAVARRRALEAFRELPVEPSAVYRGYSNIAGAQLAELAPAATGAAVPTPLPDDATIRLVHDAAGSHLTVPSSLVDAGVEVRVLPDLWKENGTSAAWALAPAVPDDKLTAFARALTNRVVDLTVPARCALPVRVQDVSVLSIPRQSLSVRRRIRVGAGSRLLVSEEVYSTAEAPGAGQRLHASTTELTVGEEAVARYLTVHAPDPAAISLYQRHAVVERAGRLAWVWTGFGGLRTRAKMLSELPGTGSALEDLQTFYGRGDQAYDSQVQITHIGTDTHGQSVTRGVFADSSRGVSRGLVRIEKEARKTLSFLSEHAMLLNRGARSDTIPILEILCRDVKATHSSSVAPVDPERVFYLESRGIPRGDAIRMIGEGFLSHVLERAPIADLREHLYPLLAARWDNRPVEWQPGRFPALSPLSVNDGSGQDEWRFDAKLR